MARSSHSLTDLTVRQLTCRDYRHRWEPRKMEVQDKTILRVATCDRCNTVRRDYVSRDGFVLARSYEYGSGYQIEGVGRTPLNEVRKEIMRRAHIIA